MQNFISTFFANVDFAAISFLMVFEGLLSLGSTALMAYFFNLMVKHGPRGMYKVWAVTAVLCGGTLAIMVWLLTWQTIIVAVAISLTFTMLKAKIIKRDAASYLDTFLYIENKMRYA